MPGFVINTDGSPEYYEYGFVVYRWNWSGTLSEKSFEAAKKDPCEKHLSQIVWGTERSNINPEFIFVKVNEKVNFFIPNGRRFESWERFCSVCKSLNVQKWQVAYAAVDYQSKIIGIWPYYR